MTNLPTTAEELGDLVQEGAIALVGAMATGAYRAARTKLARLFKHLGPDQAETVETQLDADEDLVVGAEDAERDNVREELAPGWRRRLANLLKNCPDCEQELRDLVAELQAALPDPQQQWVQTIIARDHGSAYGAQGGNVYHYQVAAQPILPTRESTGDAHDDRSERR